jgi:hypothetical protein
MKMIPNQDQEEKLQASKGHMTTMNDKLRSLLSEVLNPKLDKLRPAGKMSTPNNSALLLKASKHSDEYAK